MFNPLSYKQKECPDKTEDSAFTCSKRGELCSLYHSTDEKEVAGRAIRKVNKELPQNDSMA